MTSAGAVGKPRVSVVIPVYNTAKYLVECLDSLVSQDLPETEIEVIAVDDGSTDGSGEILDEYAGRHENIQVVHQPNSGWPGQPRNRGIELSSGKYVFFMDSDDWLNSEAMRRMSDFAETHASDIVVPRMVPADDRKPRPKAWEVTAVDADLVMITRTLSPQKLFRRSFLDAHSLRFPEGKVRLEDGILLVRAYLLANRVSVLADNAYYHKRLQPDRANISLEGIDPVGYVQSVRTILETVRSLVEDPEAADELVLDLYRRKALRRLRAARFLNYRQRRRQLWVDEMSALAEDHIPAALQQRLATRTRLLSEFVRRHDPDAVATVAEAQAEKTRVPLVRVRNRLIVEVKGRVDPSRDVTDLVQLPDKALALRSRPKRLVRRMGQEAAKALASVSPRRAAAGADQDQG